MFTTFFQTPLFSDFTLNTLKFTTFRFPGLFSFKNLADFWGFESSFSMLGAVTNRSYRIWTAKIRRKNRKLNDPVPFPNVCCFNLQICANIVV